MNRKYVDPCKVSYEAKRTHFKLNLCKFPTIQIYSNNNIPYVKLFMLKLIFISTNSEVFDLKKDLILNLNVVSNSLDWNFQLELQSGRCIAVRFDEISFIRCLYEDDMFNKHRVNVRFCEES